MPPSTHQAHTERILGALVQIQEHLAEPLPLEALAQHAGYSPWHFHRTFRALVGESVAEHIRRLRLEAAAHKLLMREPPLLELALESGYDSHEAFTRAFKQQFGCPPSEYRASRQPPPVRSGGLFEREPGTLDGRIATLAPMRVAFIRHVGPYEQVTPVFEELAAWAAARGLLSPDAPFLGLPHDNPGVTAPEHCRFDTCLVVGAEVRPEGVVGIQTIPGGDWAIGTHWGPFESLIETYSFLGAEFIPSEGRTIARFPCVECYLSDPRTTPPPHLRTEIRIPLEPR